MADQYEYADDDEVPELEVPAPRKRRNQDLLTEHERALRAGYIKAMVSQGETRGLTHDQLRFLGFREEYDQTQDDPDIQGAQQPIFYYWVAPDPEVLEAVRYEDLPGLENVKVPRGYQMPLKKPGGLCEFPSCEESSINGSFCETHTVQN